MVTERERQAQRQVDRDMTDGHMDRQIHRELKEIKGRMGRERQTYR